MNNRIKTKYVIGFSLLTILTLVVFFTTFFNKEEIRLQTFIINSPVEKQTIDDNMKAFKDEYLYDQNTNHVYLSDAGLTMAPDSQGYSQLMDAGKITSHIAGKELDLILSDKKTIEHYYELDGLVNLTSTFEPDALRSLSNEELKENEYTYALKVFIEDEKGIHELWAAIPKTSERKDMAVNYLTYLNEEINEKERGYND